MSTGPFQQIHTVSAPIKGSFPLDHEQTCKLEMIKYMVGSIQRFVFHLFKLLTQNYGVLCFRYVSVSTRIEMKIADPQQRITFSVEWIPV